MINTLLAWSCPTFPDVFQQVILFDEAIVNAKEAIELWLEIVIDDGVTIPEPKTIIQANLEYIGWAWANVTINLTKLSDKVG